MLTLTLTQPNLHTKEFQTLPQQPVARKKQVSLCPHPTISKIQGWGNSNKTMNLNDSDTNSVALPSTEEHNTHKQPLRLAYVFIKRRGPMATQGAG